MTPGPNDITCDTLYEGRLVLKQPAHGYRFSVDSLLLTWLACTGRPSETCVDLGAGSGVVGLGLLLAGHAKRLVAVEAQPRLAELAAQNGSLNLLEHSLRVDNTDVREIGRHPDHELFDIVVSNPPFWPITKGRLPADDERRVACHEVLGTVDDWIGAAARLLRPRRGRLCLVFPARRLDELLLSIDRARISATRLVLVHPLASKPAELVLVEARHGDPGRLSVESPIILKKNDGTDTEFAEALYRGDFSEQLKKLPDRR